MTVDGLAVEIYCRHSALAQVPSLICLIRGAGQCFTPQVR